jgi:hypothetical protein
MAQSKGMSSSASTDAERPLTVKFSMGCLLWIFTDIDGMPMASRKD